MSRYFNADSWLFHIASRVRPYAVSIRLSLIADVGDHRSIDSAVTTGSGFRTSGRVETLAYRFGPKFSIRPNNRLTIFGHAAAGRTHVKARYDFGDSFTLDALGNQLAADLDVYGRNTGISAWRSAQWRSAQWRGNRQPHPMRIHLSAARLGQGAPFLALRYDKAAREKKNDKKKNKKISDAKEAEQYQLFDTAPYERYHKKAWCPFVVRFEDGSESLFFSFELVAADKAAGQAG